MTITVSGVFTYPIKSCAGLAHASANLSRRGLQYDRQWMLVSDDEDERGMFLTQRELPRLSLVQPSMDGAWLRVTAPEMDGTIRVPLTQNRPVDRQVTIWNDTCAAVDEGDEAAAWFSDYLRYPARLVRIADEFTRPVSMKFTDRPSETGFSDGYPLLLISEASLDDLNAKLTQRGKHAIPMNRFRPNVVVTGCDPFAEDSWHHIRIGGIPFEVCKPCARCVTTTVDQATGTVLDEREPLATLATYRRGANGGVIFGQNVIHRGDGVVSVGAEVTV